MSCPVLSVTLTYCGQTAGWIKMKLGTEVGLSPGHTVLDGTQLPPEWGTPAQQPLPTFRSMCIVTKRLHQSICHLVWRYIGLSSGDIVLDGDSVLPYPQKGHSPSPIFSPCLLWPNSWMGQDATWYGGRHQATLCYMGTQLPPPKKKGLSLCNFRPMSIMAKRLDRSRCHSVWR